MIPLILVPSPVFRSVIGTLSSTEHLSRFLIAGLICRFIQGTFRFCLMVAHGTHISINWFFHVSQKESGSSDSISFHSMASISSMALSKSASD